MAVEECACAANLCGPTDGGSDDGGDGGELGVGACSGTCGTTTPPKATCEKCILDTLGTAADPGPCRADGDVSVRVEHAVQALRGVHRRLPGEVGPLSAPVECERFGVARVRACGQRAPTLAPAR